VALTGIPVPETQAFHPPAQRNAFRRRDVLSIPLAREPNCGKIMSGRNRKQQTEFVQPEISSAKKGN
jgi:hypothetical protein